MREREREDGQVLLSTTPWVSSSLSSRSHTLSEKGLFQGGRNYQGNLLLRIFVGAFWQLPKGIIGIYLHTNLGDRALLVPVDLLLVPNNCDSKLRFSPAMYRSTCLDCFPLTRTRTR